MAGTASPLGIIVWMHRQLESVLTRRRLLAAGLAFGGILFLTFAFLALTGSRGWGFDVEAYVWAAQRIARGESPYWEYTLQGPFNPGPWGIYLYAPPLAVAFVPFTAFSQGTVVALWYVLRVALLAAGCWAMPVRPTVRLLIFAVAAFSQPVIVDLVLGNVSVVVMVLLACTWRGLDRPLGGIAAALAMSVRPTLGVLLPWWAVRRQGRPIVAAIVAGLSLIALTLPVVGLAGYLDYLTVLRNVSQVTGVSHNLDLGSTLLRLNLVPEIATAALFAGYGLATVAALRSLRHDRDLSFIVTVGSTMLLAPLLWDHYLVSLLLPAAFLVERGRWWGLALPLLAWLPAPLLPFVAIAGMLLPFLAVRPVPGTPAPERPIVPALAWRRDPVLRSHGDNIGAAD